MILGLITSLTFTLAVPWLADDGDEQQRALLRRALDVLAEQPMSAELVATYEDLHGRAWMLGDEETARAAVARVEGWWEERYAPDPVLATRPLTDLGIALVERGDLAGARRLFERSLAIREEFLGDHHLDVASSLSNLAAVLRRLGEFDEARTLHERALRIRETTLGPEHEEVASSLNNLGNVLREMGDLAGARSAYERATTLWEASLPPGDERRATGLNNLAVVTYELGDLTRARTLFERAAADYETLLGSDHPAVATSLANLANVLVELGELQAARAQLERSLAIREKVWGAVHPDVGLDLSGLGGVLSSLGEFDAARRVHERAQAVLEATLGPDHPETAKSLVNHGTLLRELGDAAGALGLYERARETFERLYGGEHPVMADLLHQWALVHWDVGEFEEALGLTERALAIREAVHAEAHSSVADLLDSLGVMKHELGEFDAARHLYSRALAMREALLGDRHLKVAKSHNNLAALAWDTGDLDAARESFERSLAIGDDVVGPRHPFVTQCLGNLARVHLDAGDPGRAVALSPRISDGLRDLRGTLATLTEGEGLLYLEKQREALDTLLATATALGDPVAAYDAVLDAKGRIARLVLMTRMQSSEPGQSEQVAAMNRLQARLAYLALSTDVRDREAHGALLGSLREELDALDRAMRRNSDVREATRPSAREVSAAVPAGGALVDLFVHREMLRSGADTPPGVGRGHWSEPRLSAWIVVGEDDAVRHVRLGSFEGLVDLVQRHLAEFGVDGSGRGASPGGASRRTREALVYTELWEPIRDVIGDATTIFLSPDDALGALPFETIRNDDGRYLIEDYDFVYLTSGRDVVRMGEDTELGSDLLAVGGVDYDARATADDAVIAGAVDDGPLLRGVEELRTLGARWDSLPATSTEVAGVAARHAARSHGATSTLITGADATETRVKADMGRYDVVHLATHGFFHPEGLPSLMDAAEEAARGQGPLSLLDRPAARLAGLHPGLLSGLVLAGANDPPDDREALDDGLLTASEVTLLDLSDVDLVVLSACETGLGRPQSGEGLLGLRRAFHMAGADTVISSLWAVNDASTAELMESFYDNLFLEGMGRNEALRAAQLEMLERNRAEFGDARPATWGAFVLSGEWR